MRHVEKVERTDLSAFEDQFDALQRGMVRVGLTQRRAGLHRCGPGERVDTKLLDGMRSGIATAEDCPACVGCLEQMTEDAAKGLAQRISAG